MFPSTTTSTVRPDTAEESSTTLPPQNTDTKSIQPLKISGEKLPAQQNILPKSRPKKRTPLHTLQSHEEKTLKLPIQQLQNPTNTSAGSQKFQDTSVHSSPLILESPLSSSFVPFSRSKSTDIYPTTPVTSYSSTTSPSLLNNSPSPTFSSTFLLLSNEERKSGEEEEKEVSRIYIYL